MLSYGVAPGLAQVAEPAKHLVVSAPGACGVQVMVALLLTFTAVSVVVSLHALPAAGFTVISDWAAATAEFMYALASAEQAPSAALTR